MYPHESFPLCDHLARLWPMQKKFQLVDSTCCYSLAQHSGKQASLRDQNFQAPNRKKNSPSFQRVELSIPLCSKIFDAKMASNATSTQSFTSWPGVFCFSNGGHKLEKNTAQKIGLLAGILISKFSVRNSYSSNFLKTEKKDVA